MTIEGHPEPFHAHWATDLVVDGTVLTVKDEIIVLCAGPPHQATSHWDCSLHAHANPASHAQHKVFTEIIAKRAPLGGISKHHSHA